MISVLAAEAETLIFAETAAEDVVPHETESPLAGADGEILMPAVQQSIVDSGRPAGVRIEAETLAYLAEAEAFIFAEDEMATDHIAEHVAAEEHITEEKNIAEHIAEEAAYLALAAAETLIFAEDVIMTPFARQHRLAGSRDLDVCRRRYLNAGNPTVDNGFRSSNRSRDRNRNLGFGRSRGLHFSRGRDGDRSHRRSHR